MLRGRPGPQGQPPKERWAPRDHIAYKSDQSPRILYLADVSSPKLGNASREDEVSSTTPTASAWRITNLSLDVGI